MRKAALQHDDDRRTLVEILESQGVAPALADMDAVAAEAARRAELEAAFAMFGTLETVEDGEWADAPYRTDAPSSLKVANDAHAPRQLPELPRRGLHIDPRLPIEAVKALDWVIIAAAADFAARWGTGRGLLEMNISAALAFAATAVALKAGLWLTEAYRTTPASIRAERGLGGLTLGAFIGLLVANVLAPSARDAGALSAVLPLTAALLAGIHAAYAVWIRAAHRKGVFSET